MKTRAVFFVMTFVAISNLAFGQEKLKKFFTETTPDERAHFQTERMKEKLALRSEQEDKIFSINLKYSQKVEQAYHQGGGRLQRLKKMKDVNQQKDVELKSVLDKEQFKRYEELKEELRESMRERASERRKG